MHLLSLYWPLLVAILFEVVATSALQASAQFTKPLPTAIMVIGYLGAFYFLSLTLRHIPVGIAYAIWSGLGIVLISLIGLFLFKQRLDIPAIIGLVFIVTGVIIINVFSKSVSH